MCSIHPVLHNQEGQRGMSKLLETASKEANAGNKDIVNSVRHIGNKFLNSVEITPQEAVYLVLQMPMRRPLLHHVHLQFCHPTYSGYKSVKCSQQTNPILCGIRATLSGIMNPACFNALEK